jgi:hypothetical protein
MSKYVGLKIGKVHEEHIESEYYCGGCGWPVTDHDSFCPECGGAFQESFADDALENENVKLRELVEDMLDCMEIREAFGRPPTSEMCEEFAQRAGELGIDV